VRYCLYRDRKALLAHPMAIASYALAAYCFARMALDRAYGITWDVDHVFPRATVLRALVLINSVILGWRALMKAMVVGRLYGPLHAFLSAPRFLVANFIGFVACTRALWQFLVHRLTGRPLRWIKTAHQFPELPDLEMLSSLDPPNVDRTIS
jgi:adsorption protein B